MIFRKPYAFLIKHFRMIHVILMFLSIYVCYRTSSILGFFSSYLDEPISSSNMYGIASKYIGPLLIVIIILILAMCITMLVLMKTKEKPYIFYIVVNIFYIAILAVLIFSVSLLTTMQYETVDVRLVSGLRDLIMFLYFSQYVFIVLIAFRATGFDIKKFDFNRDVQEFSISDTDNEEFDVDFGFDIEDIRASVRKRMRIIHYLYRENKQIVFTLTATVVVSLMIVGVNSFLKREIIYNENEVFKSYSYELRVLDSYSIMNDYRGEEIDSDKFYIVVKLHLKNIVNQDRVFDIDNARINVDSREVFLPITEKYHNFQDLGAPYYGTTISSGKEKTFILVYELPREYKNSKLYFEYFKDQVDDNYLYTKVDINPQVIEKMTTIAGANINEKLTFTDSIYPNANITIMNVEFNNKYTYSSNMCKNGDCKVSTNFLTASNESGLVLTVMRIHYILNIENSTLGYDKGKFIENFGWLRYIVGDKEYSLPIKLTDITPFYVDNYSFVEVAERVRNASEIHLDFKIRDKLYTYLVYEKKD